MSAKEYAVVSVSKHSQSGPYTLEEAREVVAMHRRFGGRDYEIQRWDDQYYHLRDAYGGDLPVGRPIRSLKKTTARKSRGR